MSQLAYLLRHNQNSCFWKRVKYRCIL